MQRTIIRVSILFYPIFFWSAFICLISFAPAKAKLPLFMDCSKMLVGIGVINLIFFLDKIDKRRAARKAAKNNDSE